MINIETVIKGLLISAVIGVVLIAVGNSIGHSDMVGAGIVVGIGSLALVVISIFVYRLANY